MNRRKLIPVVIVLGLILAAPMAFARNLNPGISPPNSTPFGMTYGEWSAKWWEFVFSLPAPDNPLLQDDKCSAGQSGKVWYLTGKFCVSPECSTFLTVTRSCTIPSGKALFFPIANAENDNLGVSPPLSVAELRAGAAASQDSVTTMTAEIDGEPVDGLSPPKTSPYRVVSPVFSYTIPDDNIFEALGFPFGAQTVSPAVADGVFLMLATPHVGEHTIRFTATFSSGFGFDITYHLTIKPGAH